MFIRKKPRRGKVTPCRDPGQGLVEYALILVLVAVVVIAVLTLLGDEVATVFCTVTVSIGGSSGDSDGACAAPIVNCVGGASPEANVFDDKDEIQRVEFYVNGALIRTEYQYHYCMGGGNGPVCPSYPIPPGAVVKMVAYDQDGNSGECSFSN